jgi:hypothetical protein
MDAAYAVGQAVTFRAAQPTLQQVNTWMDDCYGTSVVYGFLVHVVFLKRATLITCPCPLFLMSWTRSPPHFPPMGLSDQTDIYMKTHPPYSLQPQRWG